jgi:predicted site-specific integrase-resolvase
MDRLRIKTRNTLCGWVRAGKIKAIRMPDGSYRFDELVVLAWLERRNTTRGA